VSNETKVSNPALNNSIQRKCPGCNKGTKIVKEEEEKLLKKEASGSTHEVTPELESSISAIRGGGQPLPESARDFFEPRFGHDFSGYGYIPMRKRGMQRVHLMQRHLLLERCGIRGGRVCTWGECRRGLMAHELAHVVQQDSRNRPLRGEFK